MSDPRRTVAVMALDIPRLDGRFEVVSDFQPAGDQPAAIDELERRVRARRPARGAARRDRHRQERHHRVADRAAAAPDPGARPQQDPLRAAGQGVPRAAAATTRSSTSSRYYDYYQPEAYIPQTDTYIEKDSSINEEVERLRHSATMSLLTRRDVDRGRDRLGDLRPGHPAGIPRPGGQGQGRRRRSTATSCCAGWSTSSTRRNDMAFNRGTFRVRGDTLEIIPAYEELAVRIELFGDEVEKLYYLHPLTGDVVREVDELLIFPATHYAAGPERMERAIRDIEAELAERLAELERQGKLLEAQRLRMRTTYDIEMMRQVGFCSGIENYSMHIDGRAARQPAALPARLLPRRLPHRDRRVARDDPADRRHVRGRRLPQADADRARLPAAQRRRQPAAALRRVPGAGRARWCSCPRRPARGRCEQAQRRVRRAGHPPHRPGRPARSWSSRPRARSTT